jgi:hypothetical protein
MFELAVVVAEETRPWEGRVFSVCVVGLVNEGYGNDSQENEPFGEIATLLLPVHFDTALTFNASVHQHAGRQL